MRRAGRRAIAIVSVLAACAVWGQVLNLSRQPGQIQDLTPFADPLRDDWEVERFERRAHEVLDALGVLLVDGAYGDREAWSALVVSDAVSSSLVPRELERRTTRGGTRIVLGGVGESKPRPLRRAWRESTRAAGLETVERVKLKVVGAEPAFAAARSAARRA